MEGNVLRGVVAERFGSCTKFAEALNWSGRKTRDIVSGRQEASGSEIMKMADVLKIHEPAEIVRVFFSAYDHKM